MQMILFKKIKKFIEKVIVIISISALLQIVPVLLQIVPALLQIFPALLQIFPALLQIFPNSAEAQEPSKQEIQAAMIIKFTDFIEWPEHSFEPNSDTFKIAVLGDNEYEGLFEPFANRSFNGKKLKIINYSDIEKIYADIKNIGKIQILIISASEKKRIKPLLEKLCSKPILTIGDFAGFAASGGIINFFRKPNNRIGFEINMESKELSGIKISSHLLKLCKITIKKENKND